MQIRPPRLTPPLEPDFQPAALWCEGFRRLVDYERGARAVTVALVGDAHGMSLFETRILPPGHPAAGLNAVYLERLLKFLLWQKGGRRVLIAGADELVPALAHAYSPGGARAFDAEFIGQRIFVDRFSISAVRFDELVSSEGSQLPVGRNMDGCRIGFDLGGTSRKVAATIDGRVVFSEEHPWEPYFQSDPQYHLNAVRESLTRAAASLPRVDAIGGSSAGVFVNNEVRASALFRGVAPDRFERDVRWMFSTLKREWGGIPFEIANDGDVTALAGSIALGAGAVLGISMGTSQAVGYVNARGNLTHWMNELAFAPIEFRPAAPCDEWSGDRGCGVQYFSQQAVARWADRAGLVFPDDTPLTAKVRASNEALSAGDRRASAIYETLGVCLGYGVAHYASFYEMEHVLVLGGVTSGEAGAYIARHATAVLRAEFPSLADKITIHAGSAGSSRHAQAVAAASLPTLSQNSPHELLSSRS